ncbi:MAG: MauE/DoxX family redox-associated membrane protein [Flavipsychrobacter sp.]|nr:MauE/DoxX family redox-associated membrane protein [Flavipsychrobacter sp.]
MRLIYKYLLITLSVIIGGVFLYSAYTKLFPIQRFEYTMVDTVHLPWLVAALAARLFIGFEATLGILILTHFYGYRKWVLKAALALLIFFSIYLIYLWATQGNNINCGCFGDDIWMSPFASLIKNILLIAGISLLLRYHHGWRFPKSNMVSFGVLVALLILPFILFALPSTQPEWLGKNKYLLDLSALYAPGKKDPPATNLATGKHIIAFFSPTCTHCQMAAYKMHLMKISDTTLPFFFVIGGTHDIQTFWDKTHASGMPFTRLSQDPFIHLAGTSWPAIYFIDNDTVVAKANYVTLSQQQIENWLINNNKK